MFRARALGHEMSRVFGVEGNPPEVQLIRFL